MAGDDAALVARTAAGDARAYGVLVRRHADRSIHIAERLLGDRGGAEDAVQEAFAKLWQQADRFDPQAARFSTWFYRVVANAALDRRRRELRRTASPLPPDFDPPDDAPDAEAQLAAGDRSAAVRAALQALPDRQRLALVLCYFEDCSNAEAAAIMGLTAKALESLLVRARRALKETMTDV